MLSNDIGIDRKTAADGKEPNKELNDDMIAREKNYDCIEIKEAWFKKTIQMSN